MLKEYYKFPFDPSLILRKERLPRWRAKDEIEAVKDHIYLILITRQSEFRSYDDFGCSIWNDELEIPKNIEVNTWVNRLKHSILRALAFEKRLSKTKVIIELEKVDDMKPDDYKKIDVVIQGYLPNVQQDFEFRRTLIFHPMSFRK